MDDDSCQWNEGSGSGSKIDEGEAGVFATPLRGEFIEARRRGNPPSREQAWEK
jgi:hypothetical protein